MRKNKLNDYKKIFLLIAIVVIVVFISIATYKGARAIQVPEEVVETSTPIATVPEVRFAKVDIEAASAIVYDINEQKVLFTKNEYEKRPLASITKIMTIFAADKLLKDTTKVSISTFAYNTYGEYGIYPNEMWERKDLQDYTLIVSSNDGAVALAEAAGGLLTQNTESSLKVGAFIDYMNKLAREIGLTATTFENPSGLDTEDPSPQPQAYGSSSDIAKLLSHIIIENPNVLEASSEKQRTFSAGGKKYTANNTNDIVGTIPGLIASKTGYTDAAGGNLAVVYDSGLNRPITIVILGSSKDGRFTDMSRLIDHTQEYFKKKSVKREAENMLADEAVENAQE